MATTGTRRLAVVIMVVAAVAVASRADEPKRGPTLSPLVGTWKAVSARYGGEETPLEDGYTHLKHVTPTQFMWANYDSEGKVGVALGGSYTLKGDEYVEVPEYGVGRILESLKGKPQTFKWKVEG